MPFEGPLIKALLPAWQQRWWAAGSSNPSHHVPFSLRMHVGLLRLYLNNTVTIRSTVRRVDDEKWTRLKEAGGLFCTFFLQYVHACVCACMCVCVRFLPAGAESQWGGHTPVAPPRCIIWRHYQKETTSEACTDSFDLLNRTHLGL